MYFKAQNVLISKFYENKIAMTLSLIDRLEIGYISWEIKVRDWINELC